MMKNLLATTALVVLASSAMADAPTVGLSGYTDTQLAVKDEKSNYDNAISNTNRNTAIRNKSKAAIHAVGKTDMGLGYGAVVQLKTVSDTKSNYFGNGLDKTYVFLESNLGRLEAGTAASASATMKIDASNVAVATGGIDGDMYDYINMQAHNTSGTATVAMTDNTGAYVSPQYYKEYFIASPDPLLEHIASYFSDKEYQAKVTYYSPRMYGVQLGVSYTPDSTKSASMSTYSSENRAASTTASTNREFLPYRKFKNVFSAGVNYTNQFDEITFSTSATFDLSKSFLDTSFGDLNTTNANHGAKTFAFGASATWLNFTAAASYSTWDKRMFKQDGVTYNRPQKDASVVTAGLSYVQGPIETSFTYMKSDYRRNVLNSYSLGMDYMLADGVKPYAEFNWFDMKSNRRLDSNKPNDDGNVFLTGIKVKF